MTPILQTRNLVFQHMIRYPDMEFGEGRTTFLTGPSGVGKSTLLHLMNGTLTPSDGEILYRCSDIAEMDTLQLRRAVLLVRQAAFLFDESIEENFGIFHRYREETEPSMAEIREWLKVCLAEFPLDQNCATLSGGERQRVYLAVALSFRPNVLLLDEPTSALDSGTGTALLEQLLAYCGERVITPVVVCHDEGLTERFAKDKIVLSGGVRHGGLN